MNSSQSDQYALKSKIRVSIWNPTPYLVNSSLLLMEKKINSIFDLEIKNITALEDVGLAPCDLLVCAALGIEDEMFETWLRGIVLRIPHQNGIAIPVVVLSRFEIEKEFNLFHWVVSQNCYFDIVNPDHFESVGIRIANFLRFHDHLHEISRMNGLVDSLHDRVQLLEKQLLANR